MKVETKVLARLNQFGWDGRINFQLIQRGPENGKISVSTGITMETYDANSCIPDVPTFSLKRTEAQELMDELWNCGVRPSEGIGSAGSMASTERHLKDMRAIVGHKLGVELK